MWPPSLAHQRGVDGRRWTVMAKTANNTAMITKTVAARMALRNGNLLHP